LAWRTAANDIDWTIAYPGSETDCPAAKSYDRARDHRRFGEIKPMYASMDRIDIDGGHIVETGLLEAKAQATGAGKEVDANRS